MQTYSTSVNCHLDLVSLAHYGGVKFSGQCLTDKTSDGQFNRELPGTDTIQLLQMEVIS